MIDLADKTIYRDSLTVRLRRAMKRAKMRRRLAQLNYIESNLRHELRYVEKTLGDVRVERARLAYELRRGELMR